MKKLSIIVVTIFVAISFTSCFNNVKSNYTPIIYTNYFMRNTTDTLGLLHDYDTGLTSLDTIFVGDTIRSAVAFDAVGNSLTAAAIEWDSTYMAMTLSYESSKEVMAIILDTVAARQGQFKIAPDYVRGIVVPFQYIAKKEGAPKLTFRVESDSEYSPQSQTVICPQVVKK